MVAVVNSVADVVNLALVRLGSKNRIGSIWDGSLEAKVALDCYSQTRDAVLRDGDWGFAERSISLTLLKSAPASYVPPNVWSNAYPPLPWNFEYAYNDDFIKVRAIKPAPIFVQDFDPKPVVFRIANDDTFTPSQKVILCNVPNAICIYTAQVTDPTVWEPLFIETLAAALARRMAVGLSGPDMAKAEAADEQVEMGAATASQG